MNVIITNFTSLAEEILYHSTLGGPVGTISGLIVNNDTDATFVDSSAKGAIGGIIGGTAGGLISGERFIGPTIGGILGGALTAKIARGKSIKKALKDLYREVEESKYQNDNVFGFSENEGESSQESSKSFESEDKKIEARAEVKRLQAEKENLSSKKKEYSENAKKHEQQTKVEQTRTDPIKEIYGEPKTFDSYDQFVDNNVKNSINKWKEDKRSINETNKEISEIDQKISDAKAKVRDLSSNDNKNSTLQSSTTQDIIRDHNSDMNTAFGLK